MGGRHARSSAQPILRGVMIAVGVLAVGAGIPLCFVLAISSPLLAECGAGGAMNRWLTILEWSVVAGLFLLLAGLLGGRKRPPD